jgi:hypothetical protein
MKTLIKTRRYVTHLAKGVSLALYYVTKNTRHDVLLNFRLVVGLYTHDKVYQCSVFL